MNYDKVSLDEFIKNAIREDVGDGDHTSLSCIPNDAQGRAKLLVKDNGILAGVEVAKRIFEIMDPDLQVDIMMTDGQEMRKGDVAFTVSGRDISILTAERLVLNVMQRMSGIATETNRYVQLLSGLKTKVLDTRKTTPGMRMLEKSAVKIGGGVNHRIGLYDMILVKDNHIDFAGGIENAINNVHAYLKKHSKDLKIEVEARSIDDIRRIMAIGGVNRIMLDNFDLNQTREAVELIDGQYETESSGGITFENLRQYAECGVDYISVGALTHQIKSLDLSLKAF